MISLRPPGRRTITSGRSRPSSRVDRHFGLEIGIGREPACSSTFLRLCSPQRPRALGLERSALTRLRGLVADLGVAGVEQLRPPRAGRHSGRPAPSRPPSGLPHSASASPRPAGAAPSAWLALLVGLVEAGVGALEELLLRLARAIWRRSRGTGRSAPPCAFMQLLHPRLEIARVGLQRGQIAGSASSRSRGDGVEHRLACSAARAALPRSLQPRRGWRRASRSAAPERRRRPAPAMIENGRDPCASFPRGTKREPRAADRAQAACEAGTAAADSGRAGRPLSSGRLLAGLGELLEDHVALQAREMVDEQDAFEMVHLVLEADRQQAVDLLLMRLAVARRASGRGCGRGARPRHIGRAPTGSLRYRALLVSDGSRISGLMKTRGSRTGSPSSLLRLLQVDHQQPLRHADLDRGEADAGRVVHRLEHVGDQRAQLVVDRLDGRGNLPQHAGRGLR